MVADYSLNIMRMRAMNVHLAHNQEVWFKSSIRNSPIFVGLVGFGSGDVKSQNKRGDTYKVAIVVLQSCDCLYSLTENT